MSEEEMEVVRMGSRLRNINFRGSAIKWEHEEKLSILQGLPKECKFTGTPLDAWTHAYKCACVANIAGTRLSQRTISALLYFLHQQLFFSSH